MLSLPLSVIVSLDISFFMGIKKLAQGNKILNIFPPNVFLLLKAQLNFSNSFSQ